MLPSIKFSCINNHITNSCCKADNDTQITLYKWRYTIQQKQNNFEHKSNLCNEYYDQCYASVLHSMKCFKIYPHDIIDLYIYQSKACVEPKKQLLYSTKVKYDDITRIG